MIRIKRILGVLILVLLFSTTIKVKASDYVAIEKSDGNGYITYRGTSTQVMIPTTYTQKETEFRGVWVSPLTGDISSYSTQSQYKNEILGVFKVMEYYNMNTLVFHVRIMNDALYKSKYNRWSSYYNTNPDWDALPWIIEECHKRGYEFHAWMNPYRVTTNTALSDEEITSKFNNNNPARNPEYLLRGSYVILNPGEPAVRSFLVNTCLELMENYDIDGINFDDYFYVSGIDDTKTMQKYNSKALSKDNWRREQIDLFIEQLSKSMRKYNLENNKRVQLGIAPAGIWKSGNGVVTYDANGTAITTGSNTSEGAFQCYGNYLYADVKKWVDNEWIDYILPQTYWALEHPACPYADLVSWWDKVVKNKKVNLVVALALYQRASSSGSSWYTNPEEGYNEVMFDNSLDNVLGTCVYDFKSLRSAMTNSNFFVGVKGLWSKKKISPEIRTMDSLPIGSVQNLKVSKTSGGYKLAFDVLDDAKYYVIYRSEGQITYSPNQVLQITSNLSGDEIVEFIDEVDTNTNYYYAVKAQSRSLTLGEGTIISTEFAVNSDLLDLGTFDEIIVDDNRFTGESVKIRFSKIYYPFGNEITYKLKYSYDNIKWNEVNSFQYQRDLFTYGVYIPEGVDKIYYQITGSNNLGTADSGVKSFDIVEALGDITGFGYLGTAFSGGSIDFVWNNFKISNDVKYQLQYSQDNLAWTDIAVVGKSDRAFTTYNYTLPNDNASYYYRVVGEHNGIYGYSDVITINTKKYLGDFEEYTINGEAPISKYISFDGDELIIKWKKAVVSDESVSYTVKVSSDLTNWLIARSYNSSSSITEKDGYYTQKLAINNYNYKIYVVVEAQTVTKEAKSELFVVYVVPDFFYYDEIANFLVTDQKTAIKEANIFN